MFFGLCLILGLIRAFLTIKFVKLFKLFFVSFKISFYQLIFLVLALGFGALFFLLMGLEAKVKIKNLLCDANGQIFI